MIDSSWKSMSLSNLCGDRFADLTHGSLGNY
jgi:hypothetical protein